MKTYNNDPQFKSDFVRECRWHREQDKYIKGTYAQETGDKFRGCSLGCSINSLKRLGKNSIEYADHAGCAELLGWPEWVCRLQDTLFERLPDGERERFTEQLADAMPVGIDNLDKVKWKFLLFIQRDNLTRVNGLALKKQIKFQVLDAIRGCMGVLESAIATGHLDVQKADAAWAAARDAARVDARATAWDAASASARASASASARDAAWAAAWDAASAAGWAASVDARATARDAAWAAAWDAASDAARATATAKLKNELLRLLGNQATRKSFVEATVPG